MTLSEIEKKVIELAAEEVGIDKASVRLEHQFEEDLGFDSMDVMQFIMEVEEVFEISVPDDVADQIKTVQQAIDVIVQLRQSRSEATAAH